MAESTVAATDALTETTRFPAGLGPCPIYSPIGGRRVYSKAIPEGTNRVQAGGSALAASLSIVAEGDENDSYTPWGYASLSRRAQSLTGSPSIVWSRREASNPDHIA
jgi:hypothetical protein